MLFEINDAVVRRDRKDILAIEHLELREGESIALLGPNGSGKSTFIGLLTREIVPLHRDKPTILFRGNQRVTLAETKQTIGYVSASMQDQVDVHLSVLEVVEGGLFGSLGVPKRFSVSVDDEARAMEVLDALGIAELAERDMKTLSTGQARRVLVA